LSGILADPFFRSSSLHRLPLSPLLFELDVGEIVPVRPPDKVVLAANGGVVAHLRAWWLVDLHRSVARQRASRLG